MNKLNDEWKDILTATEIMELAKDETISTKRLGVVILYKIIVRIMYMCFIYISFHR
jgi:hypothetical protein